MIREVFFEDRQSLAEGLADEVSRRLRSALASSERASLVVSGGSTPGPFLRDLAMRPLDWQRTTVTLTDERCVPLDDPDSNERMVQQAFAGGPARACSLFGLYRPDETRSRESAVQALRPFAAVILGLGLDGHTASLFPGTPGLAEALDRVGRASLQSMRPPDLPSARITMTVPALLDTNFAALLITGEAKLEVYRKALEDGSIAELPIRSLLRPAQAGETEFFVYWAP